MFSHSKFDLKIKIKGKKSLEKDRSKTVGKPKGKLSGVLLQNFALSDAGIFYKLEKNVQSQLQ